MSDGKKGPDLRDVLSGCTELPVEEQVRILMHVFAGMVSEKFSMDKENDAELEGVLNYIIEQFQGAEEKFRHFQSALIEHTDTSVLESDSEALKEGERGARKFYAIDLLGSLKNILRDDVQTLLLVSVFLKDAQLDAEIAALKKDIVGTEEKTTRARIATIRQDIDDLQSSVSGLHKIIEGFPFILSKYENDIRAYLQTCVRRFQRKDARGLSFSGGATDAYPKKVAVLIDKNILLTQLLEDIFGDIPKQFPEVKKDKPESILENPFIQGVIAASESQELPIMRNNGFIADTSANSMLHLFEVFSKIHGLLGESLAALAKINSNETKKSGKRRFQLPVAQKKEEEDDKQKQICEFYDSLSVAIQDRIRRMNNGEWLAEDETLAIQDDCVGDHRLVNRREIILRDILKFIDEIPSLRSDPEKLSKRLKRIIKLRQQYDALEKNIGGNDSKGTTTHQTHYGFLHDAHGEISGLTKMEIATPAKVVGNLVADVRGKINTYIQNNREFEVLYRLYPGFSQSTRGNMIVLGPWGTGKTALIRELAADPNIVTIEVSLGKLTSQWYGVLEKNIRKIFEYAQQKHQETGKIVYLLCDEFDTLFQLSNSSGGNQKLAVQKEIQQALDGVTAYDGVRLIGLSNVPHGIPIDIYRRAETVVAQPIKPDEREELIVSRFENFPCSDDMKAFFTLAKRFTPEFLRSDMAEFSGKTEEEILAMNMENFGTTVVEGGGNFIGFIAKKYSVGQDMALAILHFNLTTPRLLSVACEEAYRIGIDEMNQQDSVKVKKLSKKFSQQAKQRKKQTPLTIRKLFEQFGFCFSSKHLIAGLSLAMSSKTASKEISANQRFYEKLPDMMDRITGSAFIDEADETNIQRRTGKIEVVVRHVLGNGIALSGDTKMFSN